MNSSPFGFTGLDPSKMDPKVLMQLSQLIQQLPPDQLGRMQTLMHNMMAGFDVRKEMEEFERNLPPQFRDQLLTLMSTNGNTAPASVSTEPSSASATEANMPEMNMKDARMTILRAVADGQMTPDEAEKLLF